MCTKSYYCISCHRSNRMSDVKIVSLGIRKIHRKSETKRPIGNKGWKLSQRSRCEWDGSGPREDALSDGTAYFFCYHVFAGAVFAGYEDRSICGGDFRDGRCPRASFPVLMSPIRLTSSFGDGMSSTANIFPFRLCMFYLSFANANTANHSKDRLFPAINIQ